ncbi:MAG: MarP family serine protease [Solirubrobacteraceae bacterium]
MTAVDWIIVAFVLLLAGYGYMQGFIVGALSLVGFVGGAILGTRLGPELLPEGAESPYAPLFGLAGALLAGVVLATGLESVGSGLRRRLGRGRGFSAVDGFVGATLTACVALGIAWIAGAVALQTPGARKLRADIQRSVVLRVLNAVLPPSGPVLNALARFDPSPKVDARAPRVPAPRGAILRDRDVKSARSSVVRVLGTACGLGLQGSGWVAAPGVVVTNAHVVAGERDTVVQIGLDGAKLGATPVAFDPRNDVAVLRVDGLDAPVLPLAANVPGGRAAAILGYPENGPYDARAGRVGDTGAVLAQDAYGEGPVEREITSLRGRVRSGNSGGPMVDGEGRVVTTIFATTRGERRRGGFGVPNEVVRRALAGASGPVSTESCAG